MDNEDIEFCSQVDPMRISRRNPITLQSQSIKRISFPDQKTQSLQNVSQIKQMSFQYGFAEFIMTLTNQLFTLNAVSAIFDSSTMYLIAFVLSYSAFLCYKKSYVLESQIKMKCEMEKLIDYKIRLDQLIKRVRKELTVENQIYLKNKIKIQEALEQNYDKQQSIRPLTKNVLYTIYKKIILKTKHNQVNQNLSGRIIAKIIYILVMRKIDFSNINHTKHIRNWLGTSNKIITLDHLQKYLRQGETKLIFDDISHLLKIFF